MEWRRDEVEEGWGGGGVGVKEGLGWRKGWGGWGLQGLEGESLQHMKGTSILLAGDRICNWQPTLSLSV